jgi:hypothetical protein
LNSGSLLLPLGGYKTSVRMITIGILSSYTYCDGFAQGIAQQWSRGTPADDVSSDCATVGDRSLLGGRQRTNEMPG